MARVDLKIAPSEDGLQVTLEMMVEGDPKAFMILEATELDDLISRLSAVRMNLSDRVAEELDPGSRLQVVADPVWRAPPSKDGEPPILLLRHPGLGWLGFAFPQQEAETIAQVLAPARA